LTSFLWGLGSSGKVPALQVQNPEFKPQYLGKKKKQIDNPNTKKAEAGELRVLEEFIMPYTIGLCTFSVHILELVFLIF
jgi:hypothetical protein